MKRKKINLSSKSRMTTILMTRSGIDLQCVVSLASTTLGGKRSYPVRPYSSKEPPESKDGCSSLSYLKSELAVALLFSK